MVRILFLASNPSDAARLSTAREAVEVQDRLRSSRFRDQFEFYQHHAITAREIGSVLMQVRPDVVHFSGHGTLDGRLVFEDADAAGSEVSGPDLADLFRIVADDTRLVVLNACYSEAQAKLMARNVDAVIGVGSEIRDQAAIEFASALYEGLGNGASLRKAFEYALNQLARTGLTEMGTPQLIARASIDAEDIRLAKDDATVAHVPKSQPPDASTAAAVQQHPDLHPFAPEPWFCHTYQLEEQFVGRMDELARLSRWWREDSAAIYLIEEMGGMGKTALAWVWLHRALLPEGHGYAFGLDREVLPPERAPQGIVWWSFYEPGAHFAAFTRAVCAYLFGSEGQRYPQNTDEQVDAIITALQRRRVLLVLDGFEAELDAYARFASYHPRGTDLLESCIDFEAGRFLRRASTVPLRGKILITTRLIPKELRRVISTGCRLEVLESLPAVHAVRFLRNLGVDGDDSTLTDLSEHYGNHPLALRLLAGVIANDPQSPGNPGIVRNIDVVPSMIRRENHILQVAFDALTELQQLLLSRISAFRLSAAYDALAAVNPYPERRELDEALIVLRERGLLHVDKNRHRYGMHPVVRAYAFARLTEKANTAQRLANYFSKVPVPQIAKTLDDIEPLMEMFSLLAEGQQHDAAWKLMRDRLWDQLVLNLGAAADAADLLRLLFVDGEEAAPHVIDGGFDEVSLHLVDCYQAIGQTQRAERVLRAVLSRVPVIGRDSRLLAWTRAHAYRRLATCAREAGNLDAAESYAVRAIKDPGSSRETGFAYQELFWICMARGRRMAALRHLFMARSVAGAHRLLRDEDLQYQFEMVMLLAGVAGSTSVAHKYNGELMRIAQLVGLESLRETAIQFRARLAVRRYEVVQRRGAVARTVMQSLRRSVDVVALRTDLESLLSSARRRRAAPDEVEALLLKAAFHVAERSLDLARDAATEAVSRATQTDIKKDVLRASVLAGQIATKQGDAAGAVEYFKTVEKIAADNRCFRRYERLAKRGLRSGALSRAAAKGSNF